MLRDLFSLFPAYAGVIHGEHKETTDFAAFPRIRGGDPGVETAVVTIATFSPHMRG